VLETKHRCPLDKYIFEKRSAREVYDFNRFLVSDKHQEVLCQETLKSSGTFFSLWPLKCKDGGSQQEEELPLQVP
jgi:hypothetical protein